MSVVVVVVVAGIVVVVVVVVVIVVVVGGGTYIGINGFSEMLRMGMRGHARRVARIGARRLRFSGIWLALKI